MTAVGTFAYKYLFTGVVSLTLLNIEQPHEALIDIIFFINVLICLKVEMFLHFCSKGIRRNLIQGRDEISF